MKSPLGWVECFEKLIILRQSSSIFGLHNPWHALKPHSLVGSSKLRTHLPRDHHHVESTKCCVKTLNSLSEITNSNRVPPEIFCRPTQVLHVILTNWHLLSSCSFHLKRSDSSRQQFVISSYSLPAGFSSLHTLITTRIMHTLQVKPRRSTDIWEYIIDIHLELLPPVSFFLLLLPFF